MNVVAPRSLLARNRVRLAAFAIAALATLAVSACSASSTSSSQVGQHCADLFARSLASPKLPVPGAYACQNADMISRAESAGVKGDADIETFAQGLGYTSATPLGGMPPVYTYLLKGPQIDPTVLLVWVDESGHITGFQRVRHPA